MPPKDAGACVAECGSAARAGPAFAAVTSAATAMTAAPNPLE
ncbi:MULTISPECIES: hypothetical protein [unclassified Streptomyces]|uniref:Uncharacterized protein n=1 Tax=Streptomyces sp. R35 TaxID=3238630 RepID=A0AB39SPB5_9ACTN|nr:hypothetical protein OG324_25280 [Streptomyces sp. NBC_01236]